MGKIRDRLRALGKTATDDQIRTFMSEYGVGDDLSDADANAIAEEMAEDAAPANGLARSNSKSQPVKQHRTASGKGQVSRKESFQINRASFESASVEAAKISRQKIEALKQSVAQGTDQYIDHESAEIVNILEGAPNEVLRTVAERLNSSNSNRDEASDLQHFQDMAEEICGLAFGDVFSTATE